MVALLSGPLAVLCFVLAFLCYRRARYQHTVVLTLIGIVMLAITIGIIGAGLLMGEMIKTEIA